MFRKSLYLYLGMCLLIFSIQARNVPFKPVDQVDLNRFMGTWYEISRLQNPWERECNHNTLSIYSMKFNDSIQVISQCDGQGFFDRVERAEGTLKVMDSTTNAKLHLSYTKGANYDWLFKGDYWIIQLADDYSYTVVSNPEQTRIMVLSRTPDLHADVYQKILDTLVMQAPNINILNLLPTQQDPLDKRDKK